MSCSCRRRRVGRYGGDCVHAACRAGLAAQRAERFIAGTEPGQGNAAQAVSPRPMPRNESLLSARGHVGRYGGDYVHAACRAGLVAQRAERFFAGTEPGQGNAEE